MPIKIRQLPSETRTIRREILRGKARGPRGTLFAQVYNENRRRTAVDDADEPQLGDVREFAVGEVAVVFVGVCGVFELENDGPQLERKLKEPAVFLTMSLFDKTRNAGGSHI